MGSPGWRPPLPNARTPVPILHSFPGRARRQGARGSFSDSCRPRVRMRDSKLDPLSKAGNATGCSGRGRSALPQLSLDVFPGGVFDIPRGQARGSDGEAILVRRRSGSETRRVLRLLCRGAGLLHRAVCHGVAALGEFGRAAARLAWRRAAVSGQQKPPPEGW